VISWTRLVTAWERTLFEGVPPDAYALLRIVFGGLALIGLLGLTPVPMYWALDGIAPVPGHGFGVRPFLVDAGLGTIAGWLVFVALFAAFGCMTVGYRSGAASVASFVGSVLQFKWNHLPMSSALQVQIVVMFCLVWTNCGATLSVDSWLARRRGLPTAGESAAHPIWPLRMIRIQVALIYLNSGLWKFFGPTWRDGSAIVQSLNLNIFHRFPVTIPAGYEWIGTVSTYVTLFWEIGFIVLLFNRWTRTAALLTGVAMHLGIWATMEVGPFSWLMIGSYIAFLDPHAVARWTRRWIAGRRPVRAGGALEGVVAAPGRQPM